MKKFLLFVAVAMVCSTMSAQLVTSSTYKKEKAKTLWYVKAGLDIAGVSGDGWDEIGNTTGYVVGLAFDRPIGGSGVFWGMGLQLATKGYKYSEEGYEMSLNANKLEIPLNFGYKYNITDDIAVDGRIGGFINYDVFGNYKESYEGEEESISLGDLDYDRLGAGIQFGVGVWYQSLNFNITYQKGLIDQFDGGKENNWMISLGYAF